MRDGRGNRAGTEWQIALATFGILALELAIIRWTSGQVRIFAYFSNIVLIGAFLGMGLGVALGTRRPMLVHWTLPTLFVLAIPIAFAGPLHIMRLPFPDPTVHLWGAEALRGVPLEFARSLMIFMGLFLGVVAVFVSAGGIVGTLFARLPVLTAYSADLIGSLLGIVAFTGVTFLGASPPVWLLLGGLPFAILSGRALSWAALVAVVLLGWYSVDGAVYSPYNRIDLTQDGFATRLSVNRDFHQFMHDLSDNRLAAAAHRPREHDQVSLFRRVYDLPFTVSDARGRALVVGAGTGNDVQAALRAGYRAVFSVDIDDRIIDIGRRLHPEHPYSDPRVQPVVNDARAFFAQYKGPAFDVVCYGFLDSHAMLATMSSLRLDNYVYTEEGIRAAWRHVAPGGHLTLSFSVLGGPWLAERLHWTIAKATGHVPIVVNHQVHFGVTYLVARDPASLRVDRLTDLPVMVPLDSKTPPPPNVETTSDDWPFLYIRPGVFPVGYVTVLALILVIALASTRLVFGGELLGARFDVPLFFMGAAFLLIETRGVTTLSLLFGSTWLVNTAIFAGILLMALAANVTVQRIQPVRLAPVFLLLFLSVLLLWAVPPSILNALPLLARGIVGGLVNGLPIGFAGIIVSMLLTRSANPTASLGSNLLGAVLGGCLEYLSMLLGLRLLALLALALYLCAFLAVERTNAAPAGAVPSGSAP